MRYDVVTYFPPEEMNSLMIPITAGCSYNKCAYCNMYNSVEYKPISMMEIEKHLLAAQSSNMYPDKLFLTGAEPLSRGFEDIKNILEIINKYIPYKPSISMYGSVKNLRSYTVEQLSELHMLGLRSLYIGLESGSDRVLKLMNKGHTVKDAINQMKKLNEANLAFNSILMYGLGGKGTYQECGELSAKLLNSFVTEKIIMMNLTIFAGTKIEEMCQRGEFIEASKDERLKELYILLEDLNPIKPLEFTTKHCTNIFPLNGVIPRQKEELLEKLDKYMNQK